MAQQFYVQLRPNVEFDPRIASLPATDYRLFCAARMMSLNSDEPGVLHLTWDVFCEVMRVRSPARRERILERWLSHTLVYIRESDGSILIARWTMPQLADMAMPEEYAEMARRRKPSEDPERVALRVAKHRNGSHGSGGVEGNGKHAGGQTVLEVPEPDALAGFFGEEQAGEVRAETGNAVVDVTPLGGVTSAVCNAPCNTPVTPPLDPNIDKEIKEERDKRESKTTTTRARVSAQAGTPEPGGVVVDSGSGDLLATLLDLGVIPENAERLVRTCSHEVIRAQIALLPLRPAKDRGSVLYSSCMGNWSAPVPNGPPGVGGNMNLSLAQMAAEEAARIQSLEARGEWVT